MAEEKKSVSAKKTETKETVKKVSSKKKAESDIASGTEKIISKTKSADASEVSKTKTSKKNLLKTNSHSYQARFKQQYETEVRSALQKEFAYKSSMAIPRIVKIVVNMGVGSAINDKNIVDAAVNDLTLLSGQRATKTIARKSVSNFKLREGMPIGAKVTLRNNRMFDFLDKLISVAIPRVRDFRGVKASGFDGRGNFSFGLIEQIVFPEINYDKIDKVRGMDITIVTTARTDIEAKSLLMHFGFPFRQK